MLRGQLEKRGFLIPAIRYPSVPRGAARLRLALSACHTADEIDALNAALAELPPDQRACVALCLAGDFSHAEAAEALDMPLGTVKSHVTRGRARLLQALGVSDDPC